jgi:hypothetical protein
MYDLYDTVFHSCIGEVYLSKQAQVSCIIVRAKYASVNHALRTDNTSAVLSMTVRSQVMPPG